jgi:hypothetical protein
MEITSKEPNPLAVYSDAQQKIKDDTEERIVK